MTERSARRRVLPRRFYAGDVLEVAPQLLNKILVRGRRAGRIVEVEAYRGAEDPASHAYRGPTRRNATMFGPPGRLYVYFTYGMHVCANIVCDKEGTAGAVLLRAVIPIAGLEQMHAARSGKRGSLVPDSELTNGPAKLCQAFGIALENDGADLIKGDQGVWLVDDGTPPPQKPGVSVRVGVSKGADLPWRFFVQT